MAHVITYSLPYDRMSPIDLCEYHADEHEHLGPVQHGRHWSTCDMCDLADLSGGSEGASE